MRGEASLVLDGLVAAIEHASEHGRLSGARLGLRLQTDLGGGGDLRHSASEGCLPSRAAAAAARSP